MRPAGGKDVLYLLCEKIWRRLTGLHMILSASTGPSTVYHHLVLSFSRELASAWREMRERESVSVANDRQRG